MTHWADIMQTLNGHLRYYCRRYVNRLCQWAAGNSSPEQLPNPEAKRFNPAVLQRAMQDTIAHINALSEEFGITEVNLLK